MNRKRNLNVLLKQFKKADQYNQLRPGETTLAINCFIAGMHAILELEVLDLSQEDFRQALADLGLYFDQFEDSTTKTREIV